jgi:2-oxoglutarate ferredoxin oxidoreductase subunit beta
LKTKSTPHGNPDLPIEPVWVALCSGATYVAQALSSSPTQIAQLVLRGLRHRGTAFINIHSPCVTFHQGITKEVLKAASVDVAPEHDVTSRGAAINLMLENEGRFPIGVIYEDSEAASFDQRVDATAEVQSNPRKAIERLMARYA